MSGGSHVSALEIISTVTASKVATISIRPPGDAARATAPARERAWRPGPPRPRRPDARRPAAALWLACHSTGKQGAYQAATGSRWAGVAEAHRGILTSVIVSKLQAIQDLGQGCV